MSRLRNENVKKCLSLIRDYVTETSAPGNKKDTILLALDHLHKITAGTSPYDPTVTTDPTEPTEGTTVQCNGSPRIDYIPAP